MCVTLLVLAGVGAALACLPDVRISGIAGEDENYNHEYVGNFLPAIYGAAVHVYCSGNEARTLTIFLDGVKQPADIMNGTAIVTTQLTSELPKTKWHCHSYTCTDAVTTCTVSLSVEVLPAINIISKNVIRKRFNRKVYYFVPFKQTYQVVCSGYTVKELNIYKNSVFLLHTEVLNQTAIKSDILEEAESVYNDFYCSFKPIYRYISEIFSGLSHIRVYVDYPPAAANFNCVEYEEQINCSWSTLSKYTTFKLYYMDKDSSVRVCEDHSSKTIRLCEWNMDDVRTRGLAVNLKFTLVLHSCNRLFCDNQTFFINRKLIMRPPLPADFAVIDKNANRITLEMQNIANNFDMVPAAELTMLTYRMPGVGRSRKQIAQILEGGVISNDQSPDVISKMIVKLPCPSTLYQMKIYVKYSETPNADAYWSEPASIVFYTDPQEATDSIDPVCSMEPDLVNTNDRALYMIETFERQFKKEDSALHNKVDALKQKRNKLQERTEL